MRLNVDKSVTTCLSPRSAALRLTADLWFRCSDKNCLKVSSNQLVEALRLAERFQATCDFESLPKAFFPL